VNKFRVDYNDNIYYLVDGKRIHSKIAAIHAAQGNMDKISFHWMEDVWDTANWNNEPSTEWSELLRMRCQQLRDKYKYLALWYSSGYDSHTILRGFVDNGILLDELLIYDRSDFFNDPETQFALQHANHVKNTYYPNLKINHIRINYKSLSKFYNDLGEDWIYHPGCSLKPGKTSRYFSTNITEDFLQTTTKISDRGDIMGVDKPKLILRDGKWYSFCPDGSTADFIGSKHENFYITGDLPQLHIKQVHKAINWFESLPEFTEDILHDVQGRNRVVDGPHKQYFAAWNHAIGRCPMFYSHGTSINGNIKTFHLTNSEYSPDSKSFYDYIKNSDKTTFNIYTQGLVQARKYDIGNLGSLADRTILSKQYYIKDQAH